ncbi:MAG: cell wall-binding repeat-containing protein [Buchananella hordeovulneris]|nr:cell wall-binding repeat-containing protein [Buchananella hordeovulneris]
MNTAVQTKDGTILAGSRFKPFAVFSAKLADGGWRLGQRVVDHSAKQGWGAAVNSDGSKAYFAANDNSRLWELDLKTNSYRPIEKITSQAWSFFGADNFGAFDLATGQEGDIIIGTYGSWDPIGNNSSPGAVLKYNPQSDFISLVGVPDKNALIVRSVTVAPNGTIFAGTSSGSARARLYFLPPEGDEFIEVPLGLAELGSSSVYDLAVVGPYIVAGVGENQGRVAIARWADPLTNPRVIDVPNTQHVDFVAPVSSVHFAFGTRSGGTLYLGNAETSNMRSLGTPVQGDETRAIFTWQDGQDAYLRGVSGSGMVWQVSAPAHGDVAGWESFEPWDEAAVSVVELGDPQLPLPAPVQGAFAVGANSILVAGSWKFGLHDQNGRTDKYISGEIKAASFFGEHYYAATYPNSYVWRISESGEVARIADLDRDVQSRPLSIDVDETGILIGTRANYGFAGGALNFVPFGGTGAAEPILHNKPLGQRSISAVAHLNEVDAVIGSSVQAEAAQAVETEAKVARINKRTGVKKWEKQFSATAVAGIEPLGEGILVSLNNRKLLLLDPETGNELAAAPGPKYGTISKAGPNAVEFIDESWLTHLEVRPGRRLLLTKYRLPASASGLVDFRVDPAERGTAYGIERIGSLLRLDWHEENVWRTSGRDRYETAAKFVADDRPWGPTAILASGTDYPDALAAAPLAARLEAPILLTTKTGLSAATLAALKRGKFTEVLVLGGEGSVPSRQEERLRQEGYRVRRLGGANRFETAAKIAADVCPNANCPAFVVDGAQFPDALSAGAAAVHRKGVVLLAQGGLQGGQDRWYRSSSSRYLVGGSAARAMEDALGNPQVVQGKDRFETAVRVAEEFFATAETAMLVNGLNFPDALAASPICALESAPILLTHATSVPAELLTYLGGSSVRRIEIAGGEGSVSTDVSHQAIRAFAP